MIFPFWTQFDWKTIFIDSARARASLLQSTWIDSKALLLGSKHITVDLLSPPTHLLPFLLPLSSWISRLPTPSSPSSFYQHLKQIHCLHPTRFFALHPCLTCHPRSLGGVPVRRLRRVLHLQFLHRDIEMQIDRSASTASSHLFLVFRFMRRVCRFEKPG